MVLTWCMNSLGACTLLVNLLPWLLLIFFYTHSPGDFTHLFLYFLYTHFFMSSLCDSTPSVLVSLGWLNSLGVGDCTHLVIVLSVGDCTPLVIVLPWLLYSLGDLVVAHLELGEEDGAVLRPPAVNHGDDLDPPAQGPQVPQVLYRPLHRLKQQQQWFFVTWLPSWGIGWKHCKLVVSNAPWSCPCRCGLYLFLNSPT